MSADTGPRKRNKDKKKKKGSTGDVNVSLINPPKEGHPIKLIMDETIHVQNEAKFGGSCYSKLVFVGFLLVLIGVMHYALSDLSFYKSDPANEGEESWFPNFLSFFSKEEISEPVEEPPPASTIEISIINLLWSYIPFIGEDSPPQIPSEEISNHNLPDKDVNLQVREESNDKSEYQDETNSKEDNEEKDPDDLDKNGENESDDNTNEADKNLSEEPEDEPERGRYGFYYYNQVRKTPEDKDESDEVQSDGKEDSDENDSKEHDLKESKENFKYQIENDNFDGNDRDDSVEDGAREKLDSDEKFGYESPLDFEKDKSKEDSSEEREQEESEPKFEESPEDPKVEETESGNMVTKLSVGTALIFVAYSVIVRKWNNYVNQATEDPEQILRNMINEEQNQIVEDVAQAVFENVMDYVTNTDQENRTLQEYLETPSQSESEHSDDYSTNWQAQGNNIPLDLRESESAASETESESDFTQHNQNYPRANITNQYDWRQRRDLDDADDDLDQGRINLALEKYEKVIKYWPKSVRAKYGIARCLDKKAELQKSNALLAKVIQAYVEALQMPNLPENLMKIIAERTIDRMKFKGDFMNSIPLQEMLIRQFPDEVSYQNELAVSYLILNRISEAKKILRETLRKWPNDGLALARYGFVLKISGNLGEAIKYLYKGIETNENGTQESRFYFHLGDALQKMKRNSEAMKLYEKAVKKGIFKSKYQRSLYNVDRLTAKPWWTLEETKYHKFFQLLISNWKTIRNEGLSVLRLDNGVAFREESEMLRERGDWKQFEIYSRGARKSECLKTPVTCRIVNDFPPAAGCRRGQVKFSIMKPNTHVWPHCGPTNCRLRAHLGLVVPDNVTIRVAEETRSWKEGEVFVFDDSFEHEIWHNGTSLRLILIVDVWHPELTAYERNTLSAI